MAAPDRIDELVAQWRRERPDLDPEPMALVGRLLVIAALAGGRIDAAAAEHGLDRGTGDVLFTLRRSGEPYRLSPSDLVRALLVTSGTMTNRLDNLERRGLVERLPNPADRRGRDVQLTPAGLELADILVTEHVANEEEMLAPLSAAERDRLAALTRKLLAHLSAEAGGPS
jgi:DNA-binding MarR family transcriptional regulator